MTPFYTLICHPLKTITTYDKKSALLPLVILSATAIISSSQSTQSFAPFILCTFVLTACYSCIIIGISCAIDFIAQCYKLAPKALPLSYKLALAHIPLLLTAPLYLLEFVFAKHTLALPYLSLYFFSLYLGFKAIQSTYSITAKKTCLLLFTPIIGVSLLFFTGLIFVLFAY